MDSSKIVNVSIRLPDITSLQEYFSNIGYVSNFEDTDLVTGVTVPDDNVIVLEGVDGVNSTFLPSSQISADLLAIFAQRNNTVPNKSKVNNVIIYQKQDTEADLGVAFDNLIATNANFALFTTDSRLGTDLLALGRKAVIQDRLLIMQTSDSDILDKTPGNAAEVLTSESNKYTMVLFDKDDTKPVAAAITSIMAQPYLGSNGALYSEMSLVSPGDLTSTEETNLNDQFVNYYTTVNPINGGGVTKYAQNIVVEANMLDGTNTKRVLIYYAMIKLLTAKSLDFLVQKYGYEDISAAILENMIHNTFIDAQNNDLVVTFDNERGFYVKVVRPSVAKIDYPDEYASKTYVVEGWYYDELIGKEVSITLVVEPDTAVKEAIGGTS